MRFEKNFFCSFDSLRPSQRFFSYVETGFPGLNRTKQGLMCLALKEHNAVRLKPTTARSQVKRFTTAHPIKNKYFFVLIIFTEIA